VESEWAVETVPKTNAADVQSAPRQEIAPGDFG
jgi:hypothetical protein